MNHITSIREKATKAVLVASLAIIAPIAAFAADSPAMLLNNTATQTAQAAGFNTQQTLPKLVGAFIQQAMGLLGIVLVVLVIYAGFLWMTAQGSEEKIKKAKGILSSAVVGLILIFAAYSITGFVVSALTTATTAP